MTADLIPADEGSDRLTVDRLALIERWAALAEAVRLYFAEVGGKGDG